MIGKTRYPVGRSNRSQDGRTCGAAQRLLPSVIEELAVRKHGHNARKPHLPVVYCVGVVCQLESRSPVRGLSRLAPEA